MSTEFQSSLPLPIPLPNSLRSADAATWYRASVPLIANVLDRRPDYQAPFEFAWNLKSRLRLAAALSLWDQTLVEEFFAAFPLLSMDEMAARDPALELLLTISEAERRAFPGTVGEAIGLELWDGKQNWIMTEKGWAPKS